MPIFTHNGLSIVASASVHACLRSPSWLILARRGFHCACVCCLAWLHGQACVWVIQCMLFTVDVAAGSIAWVSCIVLVCISFVHPHPSVIHSGAAGVLLSPPSLTRQLRHSHILRPPQSSLWNFQSFFWHAGVQ